MYIANLEYNIKNKAYEIYISGCTLKCLGCHNPELQEFNIGTYYKNVIPKILDTVSYFDKCIEQIWILGGEPLDQDNIKLLYLLRTLRINTDKEIVLFTGHELEAIPNAVRTLTHYIKYGAYKKQFKVDDYYIEGIKLASSNQKLIKNSLT